MNLQEFVSTSALFSSQTENESIFRLSAHLYHSPVKKIARIYLLFPDIWTKLFLMKQRLTKKNSNNVVIIDNMFYINNNNKTRSSFEESCIKNSTKSKNHYTQLYKNNFRFFSNKKKWKT